MAVVFLFGVLWKKTTTNAANIAIWLGTIISIGTGIIYLFLTPELLANVPFLQSLLIGLKSIHFLLLSFILFVVIAIITYLVTIVDRRKGHVEETALDLSAIAKPSNQVKWAWGILIVFMIGMYLLFNGH